MMDHKSRIASRIEGVVREYVNNAVYVDPSDDVEKLALAIAEHILKCLPEEKDGSFNWSEKQAHIGSGYNQCLKDLLDNLEK